MADEGPYTELYAILHVPRDASQDDITRAYRIQASNYHPDKFPSPQMQEVATQNFQRIRSAYEVLSDPGKRQVYDIYGPRGLEAGLDLGPVLRTRVEIREMFERAEERRREAHAAARTHHTSTLMLSLTAADFLASGMEKPIGVLGMNMSTQVQASLSEKDTLVLGGSMMSRRGIAGGNIFLLLRRQLTPHHSVEAVAALGLRSLLTVSTTRQVTRGLKATSSLAVQLADGSCALTNSWAMSLGERATGTVELGMGNGAGLTVGWQVQANDKTSVTSEIKVGEGLMVAGASAVCTRKFSEKTSGRASLRVGTQGADVELGGSRRISENSAAGVSVQYGLQGVLYKVRYTRGGQKFVMPIVLSRTPNLRLAFSSLMASFLLPLIYNLWHTSPWEKTRRARGSFQESTQNLDSLREAMKDARSAQSLMAAVAERKRRSQEASEGLVILGAVYGESGAVRASRRPTDAPVEPSPSADRTVVGAVEALVQAPVEVRRPLSAAQVVELIRSSEVWNLLKAWGEDFVRSLREEEEEEEGEEEGNRGRGVFDRQAGGVPLVWDMRIPMQFLVDEGGSLRLHGGVSKRGLMGCCDTTPGRTKALRVWYRYRGKDHDVTVSDLDDLRLPDPSHEIRD